MVIRPLIMVLVCLIMASIMPEIEASHTIEGGMGSTSSAVGAAVVGEVYSNRFTMTGSSDSYELGIQAVVDQTGRGTSAATWQTDGVISRTVNLTANSVSPNSPSYTGTFSLGQSSVAAKVSKTDDLGTGHSEARIRTAATIYKLYGGATGVDGMAEINATAYLTGLGSGTANASAIGNASYNVLENTGRNPDGTISYGEVPLQVWVPPEAGPTWISPAQRAATPAASRP